MKAVAAGAAHRPPAPSRWKGPRRGGGGGRCPPRRGIPVMPVFALPSGTDRLLVEMRDACCWLDAWV